MATQKAEVTYHLRDSDGPLVKAWQQEFTGYQDKIKISQGDIINGAPAVDAIVVPTNSFGFLIGAIGSTCLKHFGQQVQDRLQHVIHNQYDGEVLVGQAVIVPAYAEGCKQATAIKYFISAPSMRVPLDVSSTPNAYLCFRAVLLAVQKHNLTAGNDPIGSVLVPGLGTGGGKMPKARCAHQMLQAYETIVTKAHPLRLVPKSLQHSSRDHDGMCKYNDEKSS